MTNQVVHTFSAVHIVYLDVFPRQYEQASIKIQHIFNMFVLYIFRCEAHDISTKNFNRVLTLTYDFLPTLTIKYSNRNHRGTYFESAENTGLYLTILEPDTLTTVRLSSPMLFSYGGCHYLTCAVHHKFLNSELNLYK